MKSKLLFVALIAVVLGAMIAVPAMAEEDEGIPTWVSSVRLAYNGRSSSSSDRIVGMVHIRDANLATVEGAAVTAEWSLPDGTVKEETAVTAFQGIATFKVWAGSGKYQLCVSEVTKGGWLYDSDLNVETCGVLEVKWPYAP
jgi:hypothetical protein